MSAIGARPAPKNAPRNKALGISKPVVVTSYNPKPMLAVMVLMTVAWIVGCLVVASSALGGIGALNALSATEWAMVITGVSLPLFLVWSFVLGFVQNRAMKASLLTELAKRATPQSVSNAFGTDTTRHMSAVADEFDSRLENFHSLIDNMSSVLVGLTSQVEAQNQALDQMAGRVAEKAEEIAQKLSAQTHQVDSAEARVTSLVASVSQSSNDMSDLTKQLRDNVEAPILSATGAVRDTVTDLENQLDRLEARLRDVDTIHQATMQASDTTQARLSQDSETLRLASEAALANMDSMSMRLADQITSIDTMCLNTFKQIAGVQHEFTEQATHLGSISNHLGGHITEIAAAIQNQNQQLESLSTTAQDYGNNVVEQVRKNAEILNSETDLAMKRVAETINTQMDLLNGNIDAQGSYMEGTARRLERRFGETLTKGDTLLDLLAKANGDSVARFDQALAETLATYQSKTSALVQHLNQETAALSHCEAAHLDDVKERVASTLADLKDGCEESVSALAARATATATLLETQSESLNARLEIVSTASEQLHGRLSKSADLMGRDLIDALDQQMRDYATQVDSGTHAVNTVLDQALTSWQSHLDRAIGEVKDNAHGLVASTAQSLKHLSDESVEAIADAGRKIPALTETMVATAAQARGEVSEIADDLNQTMAKVVQSVDDTSQATQLMQRDLAQAPARLDAATNALSGMTNAIGNHAQSVEIHANNIEASSDKVINQLSRHNAAMQDAATVTDRVLDAQNKRLAEGTATVLDRTESFANQVLSLTTQAEQSLKAVADLSTNTVGAVSQTSEVVGHQIEEFARQATDLKSLLTSIGGLASQHGEALQKVGAEAETRASRLMGLVKNEQRDAFLGTAEQLVDRLHGLAVDVDSMMSGGLDQGVARAFREGDRGVAVRKMLQQSKAHQTQTHITQLYQHDPKFRERVDLYVEGFDDLLSQASKADSTRSMHSTFLTADIGRLYVFLSQSLGMLAAAE